MILVSQDGELCMNAIYNKFGIRDQRINYYLHSYIQFELIKWRINIIVLVSNIHYSQTPTVEFNT